jgi:hypothetical protein
MISKTYVESLTKGAITEMNLQGAFREIETGKYTLADFRRALLRGVNENIAMLQPWVDEGDTAWENDLEIYKDFKKKLEGGEEFLYRGRIRIPAAPSK